MGRDGALREREARRGDKVDLKKFLKLTVAKKASSSTISSIVHASSYTLVAIEL